MSSDKTDKFFRDMEDPHKQAEYISFVEQEEERAKAKREEELLREDGED